MSSDEYYLPTGVPSTGSDGDSASIRNEFVAVRDGISAKLPDLAGNNNKIIGVNGGATSLESKTESEVKLQLSLENVDNTSDADKPISIAQAAGLEGTLPLPAVDGMVLQSTTTGVKSFVFAGVGEIPDGVVLTGNMYGLNYRKTGDHTISVDAGKCIDSLNITPLVAGALQTVTIPSVINEVYNLFLCDDGIVRTDTNVDGATLLAGSVSQLRWIGFVRNNANGMLCRFVMSGCTINFTKASENIFMTAIGTTAQPLDFSNLVPITRINEFTLGANTASTSVFLLLLDSENNVIRNVFKGTGTVADTVEYAWHYYTNDGMVPFQSGLQLKTATGSINALLHAVTMKR